MAVGDAERLEIRLAECGAHRLEGGDLLRTEPADSGGVRRGGEENGRRLLGVELVRVHDQPLLAGLGQVIGRRQREPLGDDVIAGEPDPGVVRGEPADRLGESLLPEELVPEDPVADVVRAVEVPCLVVQPVHADVMQQGAGPGQVDVDLLAGARTGRGAARRCRTRSGSACRQGRAHLPSARASRAGRGSRHRSESACSQTPSSGFHVAESVAALVRMGSAKARRTFGASPKSAGRISVSCSLARHGAHLGWPISAVPVAAFRRWAASSTSRNCGRRYCRRTPPLPCRFGPERRRGRR